MGTPSIERHGAGRVCVAPDRDAIDRGIALARTFGTRTTPVADLLLLAELGS
jgi:hypothetical protein